MNRIRHIILTAAALLTAAAPLWSAERDAVPEKTEKCDSVDSRPFLKRIFKEFPTLYTDTAYTDENYIFVIRAVLHNDSWHRHHSCTRVTAPADSDSTATEVTETCRPMVHFK